MFSVKEEEMDRRQFGSLMAGVPVLGSAAERTLAAKPEGPRREQNLVAMPLLWSRDVMVVPPARPHCFLHHLSLEAFGCKNPQVVPGAAERGVWGTDHIWDWRADGTFGCTGKVAEGITYALDMKSNPDYLDIEVSVRNDGNETFEQLYAHMCANLRYSPLMYDPTQERTFVQVQGKRTAVNKTDLANSYERVMPIYFLKGTPSEKRWIPAATARYGWDLSTTEIDAPVIAVVSEDGRWTAGEWFWPCQYVLANAKKIYHGCVHSEPAFGDLSPGKSASARGRIYLAKGSPAKLWARMAADWQAVVLCQG